MKPKRIIVPLVALSLLCGAAVFSQPSTVRKMVADESTTTPVTINEMTVDQVSHSKTNTVEMFTYRFSAAWHAMANLTSQVFVAVNDPTFVEANNTQEIPVEEDRPHFSGFVSSLSVGNAIYIQKDPSYGNLSLVAIPRCYKVATSYFVDTKEMHAGFIKASSYTGTYGIFIPKEVETIEANSLIDTPAGYKIFCEAESKPAGWEEGWTDCTDVTFGFDVADHYEMFRATYGLTSYPPEDVSEYVNEKVLCTYQGLSDYPLTGKTYSLGYKKEVSYKVYSSETEYETITRSFDYPLVVSYDISSKSGLKTHHSVTLDVVDTDDGYDAIGGNGAGDYKMDINFNLDVEKDDRVDNVSVEFTNIYELRRAPATRWNPVTHEVEPDPTAPYIPYVDEVHYSAKSVSYVKTILELDDICQFSAATFATFGNYTQVNFEVTNNIAQAYKKYDPTVYKQYEKRIARGEFFLRLRFDSFFNSKLSIKLKGESEPHEFYLETPVAYGYVVIGNKPTGNKLGFLFSNDLVGPNFKAENIEVIEILKLRVLLEIVKNDPQVQKAQADLRTTFGRIRLYDSKVAPVSTTNLIGVLMLIIGIYIGVYALAAVGLFFYFKNKFKNDEFRRLKPKQYIIKAVKNFFGLGIVTVSLSFIIFRTAVMNSALVRYNPLDVFVIVFTVAAAIYLGISIKNIVVSVRRTLANKKKAKLHLDRDVVEDGTN